MFMIKRSSICAILFSIVMMVELFSVQFVFANNSYEDYALKLNEIGVFRGTDSGFELERQPTRIEGIIMLIRLLGAEDEAQELKDEYSQFVDVPEWARGYVNYANQNSLSNGVSPTKFGSDSFMSAQQFVTLVLRALNYDDKNGDFTWDQSLSKAEEIGLIDHSYSVALMDTFTRGDVAKISYLALEKKLQYKNLKLLEFLLSKQSFTLEQVGKLNMDISNELRNVLEDGFHLTKLRTSYNEKSFIEATIEGNNLTMSGKMPESRVKYLVMDHISENVWDGKVASRDTQDNFSVSIEIDNQSTYNYIVVYNEIRSESTIIGENMINFDVLKADNGDYYVGVDLTHYKTNVFFTSINRTNDTTQYLEIGKEDSEIRNVVNGIIQSKSNDYDRLFAIHEWIADNLYFDSSKTSSEALEVFHSKVANSTGYASLFSLMCRIAEIPCNIAMGGFDGVGIYGSIYNHAWNEAFVDGRWIIVDVTSDSMTRHHNCDSEMFAITADYRCFDPTIEFFSMNHYYRAFEE